MLCSNFRWQCNANTSHENVFNDPGYRPFLKSVYRLILTSSSYKNLESGLIGCIGAVGSCIASQSGLVSSGSSSLTFANNRGTNLTEPPGSLAKSAVVCVR